MVWCCVTAVDFSIKIFSGEDDEESDRGQTIFTMRREHLKFNFCFFYLHLLILTRQATRSLGRGYCCLLNFQLLPHCILFV